MFGAVLVAAAVTGTGLLVGSAPADAGQPVVAIQWTGPCQEKTAAPAGTGDSTVECGTLRLPVDWARPRGERFDFVLARRAATDPGRRIGVLVIHPGGPGDSGVDFALRAHTYFSAEVLARFDVVGFDPRGVGRSQQITCAPELLARQPSQYPRDQAEFDRLVAYNRELRADCRQRSGPLFDHVDALAVVRDMDAMRRSLGEQRINYFGHSYGSLIGQQYAERFGSRIRSMVVSANMDHSLGMREMLLSSAATAEDSFTEFATWCTRTPACALHGRDVAGTWDGLLAKADRGEVADPARPGSALGASAIIGRAVSLFKGPRWAELASWVAQLDAQPRPVPAAPQSTAASQSAGASQFLAVFCQDWQFRVRDHREFTRLTDAELRVAPHMRGATAHVGLAGCAGWPEPVNNPPHRLRITDAPGILLIHSVHDPVSPYSWAVNVHRQAADSTFLLTYEGWGHQVYNRSDCTRGTVDDYLIALRLPDGDRMRCPAV